MKVFYFCLIYIAPRSHLWPKRQSHLKGCAVVFLDLRAQSSHARQFDFYNFAPRRLNNCQIEKPQRQIEAQTPNEAKLRTYTRYKVIAQIKAIIYPQWPIWLQFSSIKLKKIGANLAL